MDIQLGLPPKEKTAQADKRYINRYNYCAELNGWILIVGFSTRIPDVAMWEYCLVDPDFGEPIGVVKCTTLDLWADRFADRPFAVCDAETESEINVKDWFVKTFGPNYSRLEIDLRYKSYLERLAYSSSFDALLRIGAFDNDL